MYSPPGSAKESCLSVQDFGPGIPPDEQPRIFERFYRGERFRDKLPVWLAIGEWSSFPAAPNAMAPCFRQRTTVSCCAAACYRSREHVEDEF